MTKENYTIIRESGRSEFFTDKSYFTILDSVCNEYMSAGGNWDRPNMLLLNGNVVVPSGLSEVAYAYGKLKISLFDGARKELEEKFWPEWL